MLCRRATASAYVPSPVCLQHDYGSLAACVVDALECVRSARSAPQHNEALNAIVRCCERANLRLLRIAQFEPLRDRVLAVVARFLNFVRRAARRALCSLHSAPAQRLSRLRRAVAAAAARRSLLLLTLFARALATPSRSLAR